MRHARLARHAVCFVCCFRPVGLAAQLRPLEPLDPFGPAGDSSLSLELGVARFDGQRASLAGVEGRLWELGTLRLLWRRGAVALEAAGTVRRVFEPRRAFATPVVGAETPPEAGRADAGDFQLATMLTLVDAARARLALRFGTRLPTTDDDVGLERDRTDFFATVGGGVRLGRWTLAAESGLGIHGARGPGADQVDVWLYSAVVEYDRGAVVPRLALVGQADGLRGWAVRGNENLRELRVALRVGRRRWIRIVGFHGLTAFSPATGLAASLGAAF